MNVLFKKVFKIRFEGIFRLDDNVDIQVWKHCLLFKGEGTTISKIYFSKCLRYPVRRCGRPIRISTKKIKLVVLTYQNMRLENL